MRATRREEVTFIAEQAGSYRLPPREFYWWDTGSGELSLVSLPAVDITVVAGTAGTGSERETFDIDWRQLLDYLLWAATATIVAWLAWRLLPAFQRLSRWLLGALKVLRRRYRDWRRPGLPPSLNPGSNAAD